MSELKPSIPENALPVETGYQQFVREHADRVLKDPELIDLRSWFESQRDKLPALTVTQTTVTDGERWRAAIENGEVKEITSSFFDIDGVQVEKKNPDGSPLLKWNQPREKQKTQSISLPTPHGVQEFEASGFIGAIINQNGDILLTVDQEPFAHTPNKALARTLAQTSIGKLSKILAGEENYDPRLTDLLKKLGSGKGLYEMFADGDVEVFPLIPADSNRIDAMNLGFIARVDDPQLAQELTNNGQNRWCSRKEIQALSRASLINGHTIAAMGAVS